MQRISFKGELNKLWNDSEYSQFKSYASPAIGLAGAYTDYHHHILNEGVNIALRSIGGSITLPKWLTLLPALILCKNLLTPLIYGGFKVVQYIWNLMFALLDYIVKCLRMQ